MNRTVAGATEAPFDVGELFFSRTDPHGIIAQGNAVFQRVSGYAWEELLGKPHKIIRNRDTPRGVFEALWSTIKAGRPIGAYVKNQAKDGAYYWVFAVVTPVSDGYLSVRLKPTSGLLDVVQQVYAEAVAAEQDGLSPAESFAAIELRLNGLGFDSYAEFMAVALARETMARDKAIGRGADPATKLFLEQVSAVKLLPREAERIAEANRQYEYLPLNFQVLAAQRGVAGGAVAEISAGYTQVAGRFAEALDQFRKAALQVEQAVVDGLFLACTAPLQEEMSRAFRSESDGGGGEESRRLSEQQRAYSERARTGLTAVDAQLQAFRADCAEMRRLASSLEVTRVMGKVECARLDGDTGGLLELLNELGDFQRTLTDGLKALDRDNTAIYDATRRLIAGSGPSLEHAALA